MALRKIFLSLSIAAGFMLVGSLDASAGTHRKVVVKHKRVHHRHRIGLRHIGRGTKVKTETKVHTSR